MVSVTVVGATGYMGSELLRILVNHPKVDKIVPTSRTHAGKPVSSFHKNLLNVLDTPFVDIDLKDIDTDVAFIAAPPGDWFSELPALLDRGVKAITMGGKFRIKNAATDKEVYGGYENECLLKERVYGLPEVYRKEIKKARFITNPGCYATSIILGILPLKEYQKDLDLQKVVVTSISGTSGAGATLTEKMHHPEVSGNIRPYNTLFHRHTPEIESILNESFKDLSLSFIPIVGDYRRGIVSNITVFTGSEPKDLTGNYKKRYQDEPFVRIIPETPEIANVVDSNYCDINSVYDPKKKRIITISALDNLIKGGSGQAVQNMNIALGFEEKTGLGMVAGHP
ncbi:MAG: N-acetyl-gamma-glutamyl-phosphate reductase [Candidatus Altiarchaeia archaeon]